MITIEELKKLARDASSYRKTAILVTSVTEVIKLEELLQLGTGFWRTASMQFPNEVYLDGQFSGRIGYATANGDVLYSTADIIGFYEDTSSKLTEVEETRLIQFSNWCRECYPNEEVGEDNLTEWVKKVYNKTIIEPEKPKSRGRIPLIGHGLKEGNKIRFNKSYCPSSQYKEVVTYVQDLIHSNIYTIKSFQNTQEIKDVLGRQENNMAVILDNLVPYWRPLDIFDYVD